MKKSLLFLAFFSILFSACKKSDSFDAAKQAAEDDAKIQAYLKANPSITATKDPSGLYYQILVPGNGTAPTIKSTVTIAYTGKLLDDGSTFQTLPNYTDVLNNLIQGWKIGVPFIKPRGRILLIIPSALGYANVPKTGIPANSVLIFTIDLFAVQG